MKQSIFWDLIDPADKAGLSRHLRDVALPQAMVLCDVGDPIECVYFPTDGMVSVVTRTGEGKAIETGTVGREGIVSSAVIGMEHSVEHVVVQIAGAARRVSRGAFLATYNESNRHDQEMWTYFAFDVFASGLCQLETGRVDDAIKALDSALSTSWAMGEVVHGELLAAIGILEYETRDPKRGTDTIRIGYKYGDAKLRGILETWAKAVGLP